jgi:hypothetical protein
MMNHYVYFFDANGMCLSSTTLNDPLLLEELFQLSGAATYVASDLLIPLARARCVDGEISEVAPTISLEQQWQAVRTQRNQLLVGSDWTQLPDVPLATKEAWATYRQALRDITTQTDPFELNWPVTP